MLLRTTARKHLFSILEMTILKVGKGVGKKGHAPPSMRSHKLHITPPCPDPGRPLRSCPAPCKTEAGAAPALADGPGGGERNLRSSQAENKNWPWQVSMCKSLRDTGGVGALLLALGRNGALPYMATLIPISGIQITGPIQRDISCRLPSLSCLQAGPHH